MSFACSSNFRADGVGSDPNGPVDGRPGAHNGREQDPLTY